MTAEPTEQTKNRFADWVNSLLVITIAYALATLTLELLPEQLSVNTRTPISISVNKAQNNNPFNPEKLGRSIAAAHLFGVVGEKVEIITPSAPTELPETKLNLALAGVFAYEPHELAIAIISSGGRNEQVYGIGDTIVGDATLRAVFIDRVIIDNRGREETLHLPKDVSPISLPRIVTEQSQNASNSAPLDIPSSPKELRDKLVKNPSMLGKIISATPYQEGGKLKGYRLHPKQNPEILASQGIMPNDIITQVNGINLNSQKKGIRALRKLVKADNIELTILRDGIEIPIVISMQQ